MSEDVRVLFRELAGLPPAQREDQYARRRVSPAIRAELESLFNFDATVGDSFAGVVGSAAEHFLTASAPVPVGGRCGPYRLDRLIADGGMGAVYLAERVDGELKQRVAIKFLRTGAEPPFFRERFLRERQILASLNHPGIARLLDAGHTGGHPYLVMEYVDGIRVDQYAAGLDARQVLALVVRVAEAVSYAHRNLVIHRDLKPSNILVDGAGQPKLLDFGIAKILDASEETRTMERMMTPEYASPEQLRGDAQATTTDVYSLGAVLYRLLTGVSPQAAAAAPALALNESVSGDLAAILSKSMREEPEERYASMDLFVADLQAYLDHRPVLARRGNAFYAARKFVRRHWLPMAAGLLAVAGLAGGLLVANRERAIAERRFQQVRQLSNRFLDLDAEIRPLVGSTNARKRIVSDSLEYLERLGSEARLAGWGGAAAPDHDLALDLARAYLRVARVQGVPGHATLGQFAQAKLSLSRADTLLVPVLANPSFPRRRDALFASAEIAHDGMILAETEQRQADARLFAAKASGHLETLLRANPPTAAEARIAAQIYANLALTHQKLHQLEESAAYARRAVDFARRADNNQRLLGMGLSMLANTARFAGNFDEALRAIGEARDVAAKAADRNSIEGTLMLSAARWREGVILGELNNISLGRPQDALPLLQEAFDLAEGLARKDPHDYTSRTYVSMAGRELGDLLRDSDPVRALTIYDHTRARLEEVRHNPKARRDQVWLLTGAAYACRRLGRNAESAQRLQAAFAILRDLKDYPAGVIQPGEEIDAVLRAQADHYAGTGQVAEAIRTYQELYNAIEAAHPHPRLDLRHANALSRIYRDLGQLHRRAAQPLEAARLEQLRLALWRDWDQKLPNNPFVRSELAAAQLR